GCRPFSELSSRWFPEESTCDVSTTRATACPHFAHEPLSTRLPSLSSPVNLMISTEPRQFPQNTFLRICSLAALGIVPQSIAARAVNCSSVMLGKIILRSTTVAPEMCGSLTQPLSGLTTIAPDFPG